MPILNSNNELKQCTSCKLTLSISNFSKNKTRKDGLQSQCKNCRKLKWKTEYAKNRESYLNKRKNQELNGKERYKNLKNNSKCFICGESESCCLEFHHLDSNLKNENLSKMIYFSNQKFNEELSKCICLCSNCHRKVHFGLIVL